MIIKVDGVDYSPEGILAVRQKVIELRDEALRQTDFEYAVIAVILSHNIALLAFLAELVKLGIEKEIR